MLPSSRTYGFWLAVARIFTGALFLDHAIPKFTNAQFFLPPNGFMTKMIAGGIANTTGPYHDFLANVVQPNIGIVAECVRVGEVLVGCALILGIFTRIAGLGGMFLTFNYLMAKGGGGTLDGWTGIDGAVFALSALNAVMPTGRVLGLDALLFAARRPRAVPMTIAPASAPTVTAPGGPVAAEFVDEAPLDGPSAPHE
jgi:uncharacterized membrane protein YphA (DoxX/SURF4 family)